MLVLASPSSSGVDGNPYIDLLYQAVRSEGIEVQEFTRRGLISRPDVVHVHWPEALIRRKGLVEMIADAIKVLSLLAISRLRGSKLVWTAHNRVPHDGRYMGLTQLFFRLFVKQVDTVICLSHESVEEIGKLYGRNIAKRSRVVPHGHYVDVYGPADVEVRQARRSIDLVSDGSVFLAFGQVRSYKNLDGLLEAFLAERSGEDERLMIVGEAVDVDLGKRLRERAEHSDGKVILHLERVPVGDVAGWVQSADVMILSYDVRSVLNSGSALLALSLHRPVVMPPVPGAYELRDIVGKDWIEISDGSPQEAIACARRLVERSDHRAPPDLTLFSWDSIGHATADAYSSPS